MAYIDLIDISLNFESKTIFKETNFSLNEGERVIIVGKNGSGKSTLMNTIMSKVQLDYGRVVRTNNISIEMLEQQPKFPKNLTVKEAIEAQLVEINRAKEEYERVTNELIENYDDNTLLERQSELSTYLDFHEAWDLDNKLERVLKEFALIEFQDTLVTLLSGGEQRRVALATLLLKKPDVLLLDEPTNHLDVYMVEFLEELLLNSKLTLLIISHDRYFIDNIATRTIEIEDGKITSFDGGYSNYLQKKEEILQNLQKSHDNLLRVLKREEHWLQRGVTARRKRNERRKAELMELRKNAKSNPALIRKIKLQLQREQTGWRDEDKKSKRKMLFELENVGITLGKKELIKNFSTRILQKDKIAIVGHNGSGKSTLLKALLGDLPLNSGVIKKGDFSIGYFDQQRAVLDESKDLMETFCPNGGDRVEVRGTSQHVYGYLKNFLFPKEYLTMKVGMLSGGEKNRVALALLFTKDVDCLILDEPTNDLDIPTINILEENLQQFKGALLFVSHDRYFVDKIADKLFIFQGKGVVEESHQLYSEYLEIEKELAEIDLIEQENLSELKISEQAKPKQVPKKLTFNEQREYTLLPDEISAYEHQIESLEKCLSNPDCYNIDGIVKNSEKLALLKEQYEQKVERFLELEEKVEEINNG